MWCDRCLWTAALLNCCKQSSQAQSKMIACYSHSCLLCELDKSTGVTFVLDDGELQGNYKTPVSGCHVGDSKAKQIMSAPYDKSRGTRTRSRKTITVTLSARPHQVAERTALKLSHP